MRAVCIYRSGTAICGPRGVGRLMRWIKIKSTVRVTYKCAYP